MRSTLLSTTLLLALFGLDNFEKEALLLLQGFELFLSLVVHHLKFVLLRMRPDLCGTACLHYGLYFLPIVSVLVKCY